MSKFIFRSVVLILALGINLVTAKEPVLHPNMKILVVGGGGREHAMAWKIASSPFVAQVFVAPGNAGTALEEKVHNVNISATDINGLLKFSLDNKIDLTIVGPEAPLAAGIVDAFAAKGLHCFGPTSSAARLESSKIFSKNFMLRHKIPTARYAAFSDYKKAEAYVLRNRMPLVIKADGLAGGKGVLVAQTKQEALSFLQDLMLNSALNNSGKRVIIEEFLEGEELSFIVVTDGKNTISLDTSQDHKRLYNQDLGPNTGGMGAYSPVKIVNATMHNNIMKTIVEPTIRGMAKENATYSGFLYIGLMMTKNGPKVLEYNCRLGDPEAQALLLRLKSDLLVLCAAVTDHSLSKLALEWDHRSAISVVVASNTYPSNSTAKTILAIQKISPCEDCKIFHSNTKEHGDRFIANSGRILSVTALGDSLGDAHRKAYDEIDRNRWDKVQYRSDIGRNELSREMVAGK